MKRTINEQCAPYDSTQWLRRGPLVLMAGALCLALTACGTAPIEKTKYSKVETQIADAKEIKASEFAGGELYAAQEKLKDARAAEESGDRARALRLIEEASLHAQLAESRALSARAQESLDGINAGLSTLQDELSR